MKTQQQAHQVLCHLHHNIISNCTHLQTHQMLFQLHHNINSYCSQLRAHQVHQLFYITSGSSGALSPNSVHQQLLHTTAGSLATTSSAWNQQQAHLLQHHQLGINSRLTCYNIISLESTAGSSGTYILQNFYHKYCRFRSKWTALQR
jgi:hypothetical protein